MKVLTILIKEKSIVILATFVLKKKESKAKIPETFNAQLWLAARYFLNVVSLTTKHQKALTNPLEHIKFCAHKSYNCNCNVLKFNSNYFKRLA